MKKELLTTKTVTDHIRLLVAKIAKKSKFNEADKAFLINFLNDYADRRDKRAESHLKTNVSEAQRYKNAQTVSLRIEEEMCRYQGIPFVKPVHGGHSKRVKK